MKTFLRLHTEPTRRSGQTLAMAFGTALVLALVNPLAAQPEGSEPSSEQAAPDDLSWRKRNGDFGAVLLLTRQGKSFREAWAQPARPGYQPEIRATEQTIRQENVEVVVMFSGCRGDDTGRCAAEVDFKVFQPDGNLYAKTNPAPLWNGQAPVSTTNLQLGQSSLILRIEDEEPLGVYRIAAHVCDTTTQQCVDLERTLEVVEPSEAVDLSRFMEGFYLDPRPLLIEPAMRLMHQRNVLADANARAPVIAFFGLVMAAYPEHLDTWNAVIASLDGDSRATFQAAANLAKQPGFLLEDHPPSPGHNDMLWGAYFASGDDTYLHAIVDRLAHIEERQDLNLFLTAASAQWSLSSNAAGHLKVQQSLQDILQNLEDGVRRQALDIALREDPASFGDSMMAVVEAQKAAGVW